MCVIHQWTHRTKGGRGGLVLCTIIRLLTVAYLEFVMAVSHWLIFVMQASTCLFLSLSATMATWIESNDKDGDNCKTNVTTSHTVYICISSVLPYLKHYSTQLPLIVLLSSVTVQSTHCVYIPSWMWVSWSGASCWAGPLERWSETWPSVQWVGWKASTSLLSSLE